MGQGYKINNAILYNSSKMFHHAHNFEYTLQWAVHNPNINWLCEAVGYEPAGLTMHPPPQNDRG